MVPSMTWNFQGRGFHDVEFSGSLLTKLSAPLPTFSPIIHDLGQMTEIHSEIDPYTISLSVVVFFYVEICHFLENYPLAVSGAMYISDYRIGFLSLDCGFLGRKGFKQSPVKMIMNPSPVKQKKLDRFFSAGK